MNKIKIYQLTKQIHENLPLKIEVKSDYFYCERFSTDGGVDRVTLEHVFPDFYRDVIIEGKQKRWNYWEYLSAIQAPQLRQILVGLQEVLGETAEALCIRWLGGLNPLFNREPEKVLQELVEILLNLKKYFYEQSTNFIPSL